MGRIFTNSIIPGKAIGAQKGLARDLTLVMDILENIAGIGDITINKNGRDWRITSTASGSSSGGIPDISIPAATDGGSGGDTITYVSGMAVDATNKHQINVTTKSKAIPAQPAREEGVTVIVSVKQFRINGSKLELVLGTANSITGVAGADITKEITLTVTDLVSDTSYDGTGKKFVQTKKSATVLAAGEGINSDVVSLVSHASQHVEG